MSGVCCALQVSGRAFTRPHAGTRRRAHSDRNPAIIPMSGVCCALQVSGRAFTRPHAGTRRRAHSGMAIVSTPNSAWKVRGHTDNTGNGEPNKHLAQARAQTVVDYLVAQGVPRNHLQLIRTPPPLTGEPAP